MFFSTNMETTQISEFIYYITDTPEFNIIYTKLTHCKIDTLISKI